MDRRLQRRHRCAEIGAGGMAVIEARERTLDSAGHVASGPSARARLRGGRRLLTRRNAEVSALLPVTTRARPKRRRRARPLGRPLRHGHVPKPGAKTLKAKAPIYGASQSRRGDSNPGPLHYEFLEMPCS